MREKIVQLLFNEIKSYNAEIEVPVDLTQGENSALFGRDSTLDSVDLVSLIVAIEQAVEDQFGKAITLADERAMSQTRSPFRTIGSLADYIFSLLEAA